MKILSFTDIHFGVQKNNEEKLNTCINVCEYASLIAHKNNIDTFIFCGDFYHSREFISVQTLNRSYNALKDLSTNFKNVYLIIGNHDMYYRDNTNVNSMKQFENIENVHIIDTYTEIENNTIGLCPWGFSPTPKSNLKLAFGHFDFTGASLVGATHNGAYTMDQLTQVAPLVFSGHFHINKEYNTNDGKIISIGCPYEQNWGDVGNPKGMYIINTSDNSYEFIENTISPKHIKIKWSKIKSLDKSLIKNNYIKLIIDIDYEYENVIKVVQALNKLNPLSIETEYQFSKEISMISGEIADIDLNNHEESILKFIEKWDITDNKSIVEKEALKLYKSVL